MEVVTKKRMMIFSGSSYPELAREVADHLGMRLGEAQLDRFANGELYCRFAESVRGADAFVIQSHTSTAPDGLSINDHILEQLVMMDALKRASAKRIVAVVPFYGYSRSDKKTLSREPIAAKLMAELLTAAGADRCMSVDLHTGQIQGFFEQPFDHLTALPLLTAWLTDHVGEEERVVVSPDAGRVRLAEKFAGHLHAPIAILHKRRIARQMAQILEVIGHVEGKTAIIVDDMIDTAGTITQAARVLKDHRAARVIACATHPILSGPAIERLQASPNREVVVTNSIALPPEKQIDKLTVLSVAPLLGETIQRIHTGASVSATYRAAETLAVR